MPLPLYIYGSCVSRDTARVASGRFSVQRYIARQSWISAFSAPTPTPETESKLQSNFQQRMVTADLESSLPRQLRQEASSIRFLLLDLVDERSGVVPTRQGFVTNSFELRKSGWKNEIATGEVVPFGTRQHFRLWARAAREMRKLLRDLGVWDGCALIHAQYAATSREGDDLSKTMNRSPHEWNKLFRPYYRRARRLGFRLVTPADAVTLASREHTWGLEAFHYVDDYYESVADEVTALANR